MTTTQAAERLTTSQTIASEIRAVLGRRGMSRRELGAKIPGVSYAWVNRRVAVGAVTDLTFEDVEKIAGALGVPSATFYSVLPRLDSNQQPSGSKHAQVSGSREGSTDAPRLRSVPRVPAPRTPSPESSSTSPARGVAAPTQRSFDAPAHARAATVTRLPVHRPRGV